MRRRRDQLAYTVPGPKVEARPLIEVATAFANLTEVILFGTTTGNWERRCEASLAASRRRRGR